MSLHFDPFPSSARELDRLTHQLLSGTQVPASMPMDVWRSGDVFSVALDVPGIDESTLDLTLERGVLTVRAERRAPFGEDDKVVVAERPQGAFTRQLMLGDALDFDAVEADYRDGVLQIRIPMAQAAQPRRVEIRRPQSQKVGGPSREDSVGSGPAATSSQGRMVVGQSLNREKESSFAGG